MGSGSLPPSRRTGGEAVVEALIRAGVTTVFGLPGIQSDWLFNALYDARDQIRVIHSRHEQGAAYMALGYSLALGEPGVVSVVPGPGVLNASAALATAYGLNAPLLMLAGQVPSKRIGRALGVLHELPDQLGILQRLTKWASRLDRPSEAPVQIAEAFRMATSGRPRPVALELPMDVLEREEAVTDFIGDPVAFSPIDRGAVEAAIGAIRRSTRPLIYVGSGALGAAGPIRDLAKKLQAPVVAYRTGRGVMDARDPLSVFLPQSHSLWKEADCVIALGTNLRIPLDRWGRDGDMSIVRVDPDPGAFLGRPLPDLPIIGRCEEVVPRLLEGLEAEAPRVSREPALRALHEDWQAETSDLEPQKSYLRVIREALGEDGVFVDELTQVGFASRILYPVYHPRTYISTGYQGTLGYGFQTALGVKVARPGVPVISVTGDGGFLFGIQELATAVQQQIALTTVVFNNGQYGNVQQMQKRDYEGRVIASDLHNPDFVALAESFGAVGLRTDSPDGLREALKRALAADGPVVIEVVVGDMPSIDRFRALPRVRGGGHS